MVGAGRASRGVRAEKGTDNVASGLYPTVLNVLFVCIVAPVSNS